jgi:hypothetical protein
MRKGGDKRMYASETGGLAMYQQTVSQTPGLASSIWVETTSARPPLLVQVIPTKVAKKDEESVKVRTA